jgi:hypothetical protein
MMSDSGDESGGSQQAGGSQEGDGGRQLNLTVPDELKHGVYANFLVVSHSAHEFTLDFCQLLPGGGDQEQAQADVVTRLKVAPTMIGQVIQALNTNMTAYEQKHGQINVRE